MRYARTWSRPLPALSFNHRYRPSGQNGPPTRCGRRGVRLIVLAMSFAHSPAQRYAQPVPALGHQTSADAVAATTGTRFSLRPLCVSDREALRTLFARLSPESRRRRFLTGKPKLSDRELTYFTDVDHIRHVALAVIDRKDG